MGPQFGLHGLCPRDAAPGMLPLHPSIHPAPPPPLVTWHQYKNPQDGSSGTDCPHALPTLKLVVVRRGSLCVFTVSGRAHPARQPSRTPPWARNAVRWGTGAPTWPPPIAGCRRGAGSVAGYHRGAANVPVRRRGAAFGAERRRGAAQAIVRQRGASSVAAHHRGVGNVHVRCRGTIFGAERHRGTAQTALRRRGASSVAERHRGATNVYMRHRGAIFRANRHRGATQTALRRCGAISVTGHHRGAGSVHVRRPGVPFRAERAVATPRQSCTDVAQAEWQSTTVVPPLCACTAMTQFSCASLATVYPPGPYSRHHGGVCTWRTANLRDTPCKGDVSSAVLTASHVVGEPRRLAQTPSWCHFLGHVPSRCTYRRARRLGSAFAAGRRR